MESTKNKSVNKILILGLLIPLFILLTLTFISAGFGIDDSDYGFGLGGVENVTINYNNYTINETAVRKVPLVPYIGDLQ